MIEVKTFAEDVAGQIKEYLPKEHADIECRVLEGRKNNGVLKTGVSFRMPGSDVAPIVYMEPFYQEVRAGRPMEEVLEEIAGSAVKAIPDKDLLGGLDLLSYDSVKEHLKVELINTKANRAMLCSHPHMSVEDLSAICRIELGRTEDGMNATVKVSDEMLVRWGIKREELFQKALENTKEKHPPVLLEMNQILWEMEDRAAAQGNLLKEEQVPDFECSMYVLTNPSRTGGAAAMLHPETLEQMSRLFPEGYYLLPSSVHEFLIIPKSMDISPKELGEMVRDVNHQMVSKEEILSDRVYEYDKEKGRILQVPESIEKERGMER